MNEPTCGDCGQELTLVRPGKHQCDNPNCVQNNSKPENSAHSFTEGMEVPESAPSFVADQDDIISFLYGEKPFRGRWFGEIPHNEPFGKYWWRTELKKYLEQSMKQERERAIQECIEVLNEHHDTLPLAKSESDNGYSIAFANAVNILEKLKK